MLIFYSVILVIIPILFNIILTFNIIITESIANNEFRTWMKTRPAAMIIFLGGLDVAVLLLLSSKFAGIKILFIQFSTKAKNYIYWGAICNLFIEDIPQLLIQVCNLFIKKICSIY